MTIDFHLSFFLDLLLTPYTNVGLIPLALKTLERIKDGSYLEHKPSWTDRLLFPVCPMSIASCVMQITFMR